MANEIRFEIKEDEYARDIQFFLRNQKSYLSRTIHVRDRYAEEGREVSELNELIRHLEEEVEWYKNALRRLIDDDRYPTNYKTCYKLL